MHQKSLGLCVWVLFSCLTLNTVFAQPLNRPVTSQTNPAPPPAPLLGPVLTLAEFLDQVRVNYPKLTGADLERRIATAKRIEKQGAFDPYVTGLSEYNRYNSSSDIGKNLDAWVNEAAVMLPTRSGVAVGLTGKLNRGDIKTPISPTGEGGEYGIALKAPLLRGFIWNEKNAAEKQARLGEPQADAEFLFTRLDTLLSAGQTYWDWMSAYRRLQLNETFVALADERARGVQTRAEAGDLPLIDAAEARQEVLRRQGNLVKAQRDCQKARFKLDLYRWLTSTTPDLQPVTSPQQFPQALLVDSPTQAAYQQTAFRTRPELAINRQQQRIVEIDYKLARNQRLPEANLSVGPAIETGKDSAGFVMKAGVQILAPLRQRIARGRALQADLKLQKLKLDETWLQRQIDLQVQDAVNALNTTYQRLDLAQRELAFARKLEDGERIKFQLGDSNVFMVNQRERASFEAALKLVDVQTEYQLHSLQLLANTGQL
jgi:outer membrane protein